MILSQSEIEKNIFEVKINFENLSISKNEIELSLGYPPGEMNPLFSETIDEILAELPEKCSVNAGYCVADVEKRSGRKDGITINNVFFNTDKIVTSQIKKSEKVALFLCTIGQMMESWAKKMMNEGDPATSYFIDSVASAATEAATNLLHDHIGNVMKVTGLNITNRYSPGYCNWPVSEQHLLFSFFPKNFCGVSLTDSALMIPIKTVSGIIGIGSEVKMKDYICDKCGMKDCTYRSKRSIKLKALNN